MYVVRRSPAVLIVLALSVANSYAAQPVPAVYEDQDLTVRAGIPEIGLQAVHVGDAISLVLQIEFDANRVRVEALDDDFFERAFASQKGIRLYAPPAVTEEAGNDNQVVIRGVWPFQILDCPDGQSICAGDKLYTLPVISVAYQLIDESGQALNNKSARFRPWPGMVPVTASIATSRNQAGEFLAHFPGGAYPAALAVADWRTESRFALLAGILLLAIGFQSAAFGQRLLGQSLHLAGPATRWEAALRTLHNDSLSDDEWADRLRRAVTWYCLDELGDNPFAWLQDTAVRASASADFREFFFDVLHQESIAREQRAAYLERFARISDRTGRKWSAPEDSA